APGSCWRSDRYSSDASPRGRARLAKGDVRARNRAARSVANIERRASQGACLTTEAQGVDAARRLRSGTLVMANSPALLDTHLVIPDSLAHAPSRAMKRWLVAAACLSGVGALAFRFVPSDSKSAYRVAPVVQRTVVHVVEATGHLDVRTRVEVPAPA